MQPTTHDEFELRDMDRANFEARTGKSIMQAIKDGDDVSWTLMKEDEELASLEIALEKQKHLPDNKPQNYTADDEPDDEPEITELERIHSFHY